MLPATWSRLAVVVLTLVFFAESAFARQTPESFAARPSIYEPAISPSGRYVAIPKRSADDKVSIVILDLDDPSATPKPLVLPPKVFFEWVEWGNDDRLLLSVYVYGQYYIPISRIVAMDRDGGNAVMLFNNMRRQRNIINLNHVAHPLPDDPASILIGAYDSNQWFDLFKVNIVTGAAELSYRGTRDTSRWLTDLQGVPRVRWDYDEDDETLEVFLRNGDTDNWSSVTKFAENELPDLDVVGFGDDPRNVIVASRQAGDRYAMYEYDMLTHKLGKTIFQHPVYDIGEPDGVPIYDPYDTKLLGVRYPEDLVEIHFFDQDLARVEAKLEATLTDASDVYPIEWSRDRSRFVVSTSGPKDPGSYYLYDAKKDALSLLGHAYPNLPPSELGDVLIIKYKSHDGTKIPGYLTMPPGKGDKNLPLVVMPHGGPEVRDYVQYDAWAQMLANDGYAVFQPNFRGSGGYGRAFAEAGHHQWGRLMQDDITDGVKALIADHTVDPNRICIVGASYGGYAALAGGAFTPDLYRCVVSIAGVSDLPKMLNWEARRHKEDSEVYKFWVKRIGDPKVDLEQLSAASPALHAANFKAPVLLIHGKDDKVVPFVQSERMEDELRAAGKTVEMISVRDEGHQFGAQEDRQKLLTDIERFVRTYLGPN